MKAALVMVLASTLPAAAQVAAPSTPRKFETRSVNGAGGSTGVSITPASQPSNTTKVRLVSYFSLSDTRQWKSSDGRSLVGSIIAFEDAVTEVDAATPAAAKAAAQKAPPATPPARYTLVRDGRVRLLVNHKPFEVMLERLSDEDRKFVGELQRKLSP